MVDFVRRERCGRLVEHEHAILIETVESAHDGVDRAIDRAALTEWRPQVDLHSETIEQLPRAPCLCVEPYREAAPDIETRRQGNVLDRCHLVDDPEVLMHEAQSEAARLGRRPEGQRPAVYLDCTTTTR